MDASLFEHGGLHENARYWRGQQGSQVLHPINAYSVQLLDEFETAEREAANAAIVAGTSVAAEYGPLDGSAASVASASKRKPRKQLYHVVQRLPEGAGISEAHRWAQKIIRISGVGPGARYYFEQSGENPADMGKGLHIHLALYSALSKSVLAQRIIQKKITLPNMTQVFEHDDLHRLTSYLSGNKEASKMRKVAMDKLWREANGLKTCYTRRDLDESAEVATDGR